ncbi:MAG TPA: hypothetical protein VGO95_06735 [Modestobacter sp.]|nr:hypothetical protein [Modestobacter sp.]
MSDRSDGPDTGPVEERAGRTGRPPVPGSLPSDQPAAPGSGWDGGGPEDGRHRTEQVPFPLPPLPPPDVPQPAPETGRLYLGGYPPRVPGPARRPGIESRDPAPADEPTGCQDPDRNTGRAPDGR